ncbi:SAM-dependent methyltransferase [Streptomyces sp. NPDC055912]|uniref:SAM-dependent methyltransferase n=1 Tax=Streptomyces sp. NPDC055912 TaxID=3345660 RepID=UPI0035DDC50A
MNGASIPPDYFTRPVVARVQDCLDGGTDNYGADRELARKLVAVAQWLRVSVRINRVHGARALDHLTRDLGIDQAIDLGCGLPHDENRNLPDAVRRIVYVDSDPGVEAHARMCLAERTGTASLLADLTDVSALLSAPPVRQLDHDRPIAVLLHDVLPWLDNDTARTTLEALHAHLPPGSVLSLTHATGDFAPGTQIQRLAELYREAGIPYWPRSGAALAALLGPWTLLGDRGLVTTATWRPPGVDFSRPPYVHTWLDHSHAYAALATTGERTT